MPNYKHARSIAELDFYEDRLLFPGEKPEDIIGFCFGLTGTDNQPLKARHLNISCRRIGVNPKYTDIRREVGNLLIQLWAHKNLDLNTFWVKNARAAFKPPHHILKNESVTSAQNAKPEKGSAAKTPYHKNQKDFDTILYYRMIEAFNPDQFKKIKIKDLPKSKIHVDGETVDEMPLLDIVRPTLLIYTMDGSLAHFSGDCVKPKLPSRRLNPYNQNLRLWLGKTVLGWYSKFDIDKHHDGGEFWYNLIFKRNTSFNNFDSFNRISSFTESAFDDGEDEFFGDPGDGMGGGERFP